MWKCVLLLKNNNSRLEQANHFSIPHTQSSVISLHHVIDQKHESPFLNAPNAATHPSCDNPRS